MIVKRGFLVARRGFVFDSRGFRVLKLGFEMIYYSKALGAAANLISFSLFAADKESVLSFKVPCIIFINF